MPFIIKDGAVIDYTSDGWAEYKKWLDGTYARLQYAWSDDGIAYTIVAVDGRFYRNLNLLKADAADFEANFKLYRPTTAMNADGSAIVGDRLLTLGQAAFLRTDDGTQAMNINGTTAGTPVVVWNGEGTYWTPGDQGSAEAYAAHDGSYGWDSGSTSLGQDTKFDYGSNQDITAYDTISFWMQPKAYPVGSSLQILWKTSGGTTKGNVLNVEDYVTNMDLDVWHRVEIPIADFELPDDVARVLLRYASHGGQQFWFDTIELNTSAGGGPYVFQASAPAGVVRHVTMMVLIAAAPSSGWASSSFANITGGIANGLLVRQRRISTGEVLWSLNSKDNTDLFGRFHPQDDITFSNGELLIGLMLKPGAASIAITEDDVVEWVVRDDLSSLTRLRSFVHYGTEVI